MEREAARDKEISVRVRGVSKVSAHSAYLDCSEFQHGTFFILPIPVPSNIKRCSIEDLFKLKVRQ